MLQAACSTDLRFPLHPEKDRENTLLFVDGQDESNGNVWQVPALYLDQDNDNLRLLWLSSIPPGN
jgi:hypothetical protein